MDNTEITNKQVRVNGCTFHCGVYGEDSSKEVMVFVHGLLWNHLMFEQQIKAFSGVYHCIGIDLRGQGKSEVTSDGYEIDEQTEDVRLILDELGVKQCHFVGLSMGGFIGLRLAAWFPEMVQTLTLIDSSAGAEVEKKVKEYRVMAWVIRWLGMWSVQKRVFGIVFAENFLNDVSRVALRDEWKRHFLNNSRNGIYHAVHGVMNRKDFVNELHKIKCPAHVIIGEHDIATPLHCSEKMHEGIAGSTLTIIPDAGHTSAIEEPEAVIEAMRGLL